MKKFLKRFLRIMLGFGLLILGSAIWLFWYLDGFSPLQAVEKQFGPHMIVYLSHTGAYTQVGVAMDTVYATLRQAGVQQTQGIGIYYSDPETTPIYSLFSEVGSIVSGNIQGLGTGQKIKTLTGCQAVIVSFPYKNKRSYMLGPVVVYPYVNAYLFSKGYRLDTPRIEVYDEVARKIDFVTCVEQTKGGNGKKQEEMGGTGEEEKGEKDE